MASSSVAQCGRKRLVSLPVWIKPQLSASQGGKTKGSGQNRTLKPVYRNFPKGTFIFTWDSCRPTLMPITLWSERGSGKLIRSEQICQCHTTSFLLHAHPEVCRIWGLGAPQSGFKTWGCPKLRPSQSRTCTWFFYFRVGNFEPRCGNHDLETLG